jgi:hypothetical protein
MPRPAAIAVAQPPKAPAVPVYTAPEPTYAAAPQTAQARAAASVAQPVNYQAPSAPAPTYAPSYAASAVQLEQPDPNALQKLNRSGKGGKLPGGDQSIALSIGDGQH